MTTTVSTASSAEDFVFCADNDGRTVAFAGNNTRGFEVLMGREHLDPAVLALFAGRHLQIQFETVPVLDAEAKAFALMEDEEGTYVQDVILGTVSALALRSGLTPGEQLTIRAF